MADSRELHIISSLTWPEASVNTAIQEIITLTSAAASSTTISKTDALSTHLDNTWQALMEHVVANTQPSQQTALVDFVRTLQQQKVVDPATGDQLRFDPDYNKLLWTEVPLFGINVADYWHRDPENETKYMNKVAFLAQLTSSPANFDLEPTGPFDFSLYALWDFRSAFENTRAPTTTLLHAASLWMIHAADTLYENVRAKRDFRHRASNGNPAREGDAYRKSRRWVGLNQERWDVWVEGLENGRAVEDEEVRVLVEEALGQVERVERQEWRVEREEMYA